MFRGCVTLKTCTDTTQTPDENGDLTVGRLESETFFTNLRNLLAVYPKEVFFGCKEVQMNITNDGLNSFLFHSTKSISETIILFYTQKSVIQLKRGIPNSGIPLSVKNFRSLNMYFSENHLCRTINSGIISKRRKLNRGLLAGWECMSYVVFLNTVDQRLSGF